MESANESCGPVCVAERGEIQKMGLNRLCRAHVYMTAYLLWVTGCAAQKVYFDCGAKVDVVDVQGLVLSPGFPYNYSSGTHCVWQFFVPVGHQLVMEMFDFDVFESHSNPAKYSAMMSEGFLDDEQMDDGTMLAPSVDGNASSLKGPDALTHGSMVKEPQSSQKDEIKQVVVQEQSTKMEMAKVSNSAKWSSDSPSVLPSPQPPSHPLAAAQPPGGKTKNSISPHALGGVPDPGRDPTDEASVTPPSATDAEAVSPETQQSVVDACPHDVLYISDLVTFSSRFCGSNRPARSQLVFGSETEMVEVIMELITTTHWGRGFALLFHYRNRTDAGGDQRAPSTADGKMDALLAAVSGAAFFAMTLTSVLCIIFRPKLCSKGANVSSSNHSEVAEGVQNSGVDVSELQLVAANYPGLEVSNDNNNHSLSLPHRGPSVTAGSEVSKNAELEISTCGLTELELGTDEVFVISSGPSPSRLPLCPHTQRERFLRHSDTGPSLVSDWPSPDSSALPTAAGGGQAEGASSSRPRAWSVRTFQDFLPPLPQLHKKWCSWNSTSPFTKLVDSAPSSSASDCRGDGSRKVFSDGHLEGKADCARSDSSVSNVSFPLAQPAQRQRRLNSTSNLRRSRFTAPCFGLLSGPSESSVVSGGPAATHQAPEPIGGPPGQLQQAEAQGGKMCDFPGEDDHISVPVFAISEEEDRQPLVLAEYLGRHQPSVPNGLSQGPYDGKRLAGGESPGPQRPTNGSVLSPRGKSEWRPWGSGSVGDAALLPCHTTANQIQLPSLSQSTVPCSLMGKDM